ncbi:helix-turn-helix transcriptional regulator [Polaribacter sp. IC073]|nr:helix-turn-helix transcriptional regulator [Polaribacter sp. IC073]
MEIFNFISEDITNKEIADKLNISVNTVKFHVKNIYEKLNIKSRKEAISIENTLKAY